MHVLMNEYSTMKKNPTKILIEMSEIHQDIAESFHKRHIDLINACKTIRQFIHNPNTDTTSVYVLHFDVECSFHQIKYIARCHA